jgi:C-terminal processing protease CtpA/Prc
MTTSRRKPRASSAGRHRHFDEGQLSHGRCPMEDTPGFKAGILTGDRIVKIENKSTENWP